jgi:hypothetical protein
MIWKKYGVFFTCYGVLGGKGPLGERGSGKAIGFEARGETSPHFYLPIP